MTKVGEAPVYSTRLLEAGKALETSATFLQNLSRIFAKKDQLCIFNPTTHQHIATGITKADFTRLQKIDSRSGFGSGDLETARRILGSAGVATDKLGVKVLISLSQLVGSGKMSSADAQKLSKISSGALQEKLIDLQEKKPEFTEKILHLGSEGLQGKLADLVVQKPELAEKILQLKSETLQEKIAETAGKKPELAEKIIQQKSDILKEKLADLAEKKPDLAGKIADLGTENRRYADQQERCGLQDHLRAWNTHTALEITKMVIDDKGTVDTSGIDALIEQLRTEPNRSTQLKGPHTEQMIKFLEKVRDDATFRNQLASIKSPAPKENPAHDMIRATLGLDKDTPVTEVHSRQAVFSAMLSELRQMDVGSCFGTSIAIMVHDHQPARLLSDLKGLVENGKFTRTINGVTHEMPISQRMSNKELQMSIKVDKDGLVSEIAKKPMGSPVKLQDTPAMKAALLTLGVKDSDMGKVVTEALKRMGVNTPTENTPEKVLKQIIMTRTNVSEQDIRDREALSKLSAEVRELQTTLTGNKVVDKPIQEKIDVKIETYSILHTEVLKKAEGLASFDRELSLAFDSYQAQMDNRLLRAWEYTVVSSAEKGAATMHKQSALDCLFGTLTGQGAPALKGLDKKLDDVVARMQTAGKIPQGVNPDTFKNQLKAEFKKLFMERIQVQYDATLGMGKVASDGSSERGGFILFDKTGSRDPVDWRPLNSPEEFQKEISGLLLEAGKNLSDAIPAKDKKAFISTVANELSDYTTGKDFNEFAVRKMGEIRNKPITGPLPDLKTLQYIPWKFRAGDLARYVIPEYFEVNTALKLSHPTATPTNGQDLLKWIGTVLKGMEPDIKDGVDRDPKGYTIPMGNGPHAFILKPGTPPLRDAWKPGVNVDTWINTTLNTPGATISNTPMSQGQQTKVIDQVLKNLGITGPQDITALKTAVATAAGGSPKPAELRNAIVAQIKARYPGFYNDPTEGAGRVEYLTKIADVALVETLAPPSVVFADSNWRESGGSHHINFAIAYNPGNGQAEMWQMNEDGTKPFPLDQQVWVKTYWDMCTDPAQFGEK